jgi:hypothetical protein
MGVCKRVWGASIPPPPPPILHSPRLCTPASGALLVPPTSMHRDRTTSPLHTNRDTGRRAKGKPPSLWPEPPMTCTGQGAWNTPLPLWCPHSSTNGGLSFALTGHRSRSACGTSPPPQFVKRVQGWAATSPTWHPLPSTPTSPPCAHPPPLRATWHANRGGTEGGRGACKGRLHAPSPSCCVAPTCAHPRWRTLSPFHAGLTCYGWSAVVCDVHVVG